MDRGESVDGRVGTLVEGAANLRHAAFADEAAVVDVALRHFFAEFETVRRAAAVERYLAGAVTVHEGARLAGTTPERFRTLIERVLDAAEERCVTPAG